MKTGNGGMHLKSQHLRGKVGGSLWVQGHPGHTEYYDSQVYTERPFKNKTNQIKNQNNPSLP